MNLTKQLEIAVKPLLTVGIILFCVLSLQDEGHKPSYKY